MNPMASLLVLVVALVHAGFLILQGFMWTNPLALSTFNMTPEFARASAILGANLGLHNGFIAAGLIWGVISTVRGPSIAKYFLMCAVIAGCFGGVTMRPMIFYVQALPAVVALIAVMLGQRNGV